MTDDRNLTRAELVAQIREVARKSNPGNMPRGRALHPFVVLKPEAHTRQCWAGVLGLAMLNHLHLDAKVIALAAIDLYATAPSRCTCPKPTDP